MQKEPNVNEILMSGGRKRKAKEMEEVDATTGEVDEQSPSPTRKAQASASPRGRQYGDMSISGYAQVHNGDAIHYHSYINPPSLHPATVPIQAALSDFAGSYAYSSLQPVATYISRFGLERQLHELLPEVREPDHDAMRTVVVWGLGGAGKSQLVLNHIREHRQQYQAVFWIEAGQKETIERDYIQIYKKLFPSTRSDHAAVSAEDALAGVKGWLQGRRGRFLWIMDSADEVDDDSTDNYVDLSHYLPEAPQLDRIITTRSSRIQDLSTQGGLLVGDLAEEEAVELFSKCAKLRQITEEARVNIQMIVEELGYLALAVVLAGSYVGKTPRLRSNLSLYLSEFRTHRERFLSYKARPVIHQYRDSVLSTWEMSFSAVKRQDPVAANLLNLLAFLNSDDIFIRLFDIVEPKDSPPRSPAEGWLNLLSSGETIVDRHAIEAGFTVLQAYSLVSWQEQQEAYTMHKLVHAWGHDRLSVQQRQKRSLAVLELLGGVISNRRSDLATDLRLVPHLIANFTTVSSACGLMYETAFPDRDSIRSMGNVLFRLGRWSDAYIVEDFLYHSNKRGLGSEHDETLESMGRLGLVALEQGKYKLAEAMNQQLFEARQKKLGQEHLHTLDSRNNLAYALMYQGKYEEAEALLQHTRDSLKKISGSERISAFRNINCLGTLLRYQGKYAEAQILNQEVLEICQRELGLEHPETLGCITSSALLLQKQGKYEEAESMFRQSIDIERRVLGPEHPGTLFSVYNLASVLSDQHRFQEAEMVHLSNLAIYRIRSSAKSLASASLEDMLACLRKQGKYEEAEAFRLKYSPT